MISWCKWFIWFSYEHFAPYAPYDAYAFGPVCCPHCIFFFFFTSGFGLVWDLDLVQNADQNYILIKGNGSISLRSKSPDASKSRPWYTLVSVDEVFSLGTVSREDAKNAFQLLECRRRTRCCQSTATSARVVSSYDDVITIFEPLCKPLYILYIYCHGEKE